MVLHNVLLCYHSTATVFQGPESFQRSGLALQLKGIRALVPIMSATHAKVVTSLPVDACTPRLCNVVNGPF